VGRYDRHFVLKKKLRYTLKIFVWNFSVKSTVLIKRVFDLVLSLSMLIVLSPLIALIILLIFIESPGSVIFKQTRVGLHGRHFKLYKFRSMYPNAEEKRAALTPQNESEDKILFKMKKDPRITRIGRCLRRVSLDELPQLINIIKGDMSLIGPRPAIPSEVAQYTLEDRKRLDILPGLTGFWQISGRSDLSFQQQVRLDIKYIKNHGFLTDLKIILKTIPAIIFGKGAY